MSEKSSGNYTTSVPFILFIVFLVLKLCKVISWSWLWVCSPLWIGAIIGVVALIILFIIALKK